MNKIAMAVVTAIIFTAQTEAAASQQKALNKALIETAKKFNCVDPCYVDEAARLLAAGADVNAKYWLSKFQPLDFAAQAGCVEAVELLLKNGAAVNKTTVGGSVLHGAVYCTEKPDNAPIIVAMLIKAGADVHAVNVAEMTPLHMLATTVGAHEVASAHAILIAFQLFAAGAEKDAKDSFGLTPVELAIYNNKPALADLIESYPGRTLQERIIFSLAKQYYSSDSEVHASAEKEIRRIKDSLNSYSWNQELIRMLYALAGQELLTDLQPAKMRRIS